MENQDNQQDRTLTCSPSSELPFEWFAVPGSNIKEWRYNSKEQFLDIKFGPGQTYYSYAGVTPEVMNQFRMAESKGSFFAANIKPVNACTKHTPEEAPNFMKRDGEGATA